MAALAAAVSITGKDVQEVVPLRHLAGLIRNRFPERVIGLLEMIVYYQAGIVFIPRENSRGACGNTASQESHSFEPAGILLNLKIIREIMVVPVVFVVVRDSGFHHQGNVLENVESISDGIRNHRAGRRPPAAGCHDLPYIDLRVVAGVEHQGGHDIGPGRIPVPHQRSVETRSLHHQHSLVAGGPGNHILTILLRFHNVDGSGRAANILRQPDLNARRCGVEHGDVSSHRAGLFLPRDHLTG